MNTEIHPQPREHIDDLLPLYVTNALTDAERTRVDQHLSDCAACRAAMDELTRLESTMTAALSNATPDARLEDRIVERLRDADGHTRKVFSKAMHPAVRKAAGIAAVVALAAVGYGADGWLNGTSARTRVAANLRQTGVANAENESVSLGWFDNAEARGIRGPMDRRFTTTPPSEQQPMQPMQQMQQTLMHQTDSKSNRNTAGDGLTAHRALDASNQVVSEASGRGKQSEESKGANYFRHTENWPDLSKRQNNPSIAVVNGGALTIDGHVNLGEAPTVTVDMAVNRPAPGDVDGDRLQPDPPLVPAPVPVPPPAAVAAMPVLIAPLTQQQKIIRSGEMEFEVESFDKAFATVSQVINEESGILATTDSQRLPNGKVRGRIVLRVAPERLDTLVLKLRALGELKSQKLAAQDVTKQYTDLQSGLRAATAMADRLLAIIKEGKGQIKDLLAAEKELGVWREKIEVITGEIRYYDNLVGLSTLTITAYEKDIKAPATTTLTENITAGVETDDVAKARLQLIETIEAAKGRIIESELKQFEAGQLAAKIVAEIPPDASGTVIDRLRQLGVVTRLEAERKRTGDPGTPDVGSTATPRVEQKQTRLVASLYNVANVQPRVSTSLTLGAEDVETTYRALLDRVTKANGRILSSSLDRNSADNVTGNVRFEIRTNETTAVLTDMKASGVVTRLAVAENPDSANVTSSKQAFTVQVVPVTSLPPKQTVTMLVQASDVPAALAQLKGASGSARILESSQSQNGAQQQARFVVDLPQDQLNALLNTTRALGKVQREDSRADASVPDSPGVRARVDLTLVNPDAIVEAGSGLWPTIRQGLVTSVAGLLWSVKLIIIGLCLVAPWVVILWAGLKIVRRRRRAVAVAS